MPYSIPPKFLPSGSKKVISSGSFISFFKQNTLTTILRLNWFPVVQVVTAVMWNKPDSLFSVPVWIIVLAVLAGLLLLALLIYLLYKVTHTQIAAAHTVRTVDIWFLCVTGGPHLHCFICLWSRLP